MTIPAPDRTTFLKSGAVAPRGDILQGRETTQSGDSIRKQIDRSDPGPTLERATRSLTKPSKRPPWLTEAVAHVSRSDPAMERLIAETGPCGLRIRPAGTTFAALAESITHQQLTGRAAATIHGRLCALFDDPESGPEPEALLAMTDSVLRGCGLSSAKVLALRDLAGRTVAGEIPTLAGLRRLPEDEVIRRLTAVRGIGRWTVEMLLLFRLGRPDILAVDDYGLRKGFRAAVGPGTGRDGLPTADELANWGKRWRPYRSVASWYLWRAAERGF